MMVKYINVPVSYTHLIINNKHTINLKGFYGTSAANIISRFYFIDKRIEPVSYKHLS